MQPHVWLLILSNFFEELVICVNVQNLNIWVVWTATCKAKSYMSHFSKSLETKAVDMYLRDSSLNLGWVSGYLNWGLSCLFSVSRIKWRDVRLSPWPLPSKWLVYKVQHFTVHTRLVVLGGVMVILLSTGPNVRGFKPGLERDIFKGDKNHITSRRPNVIRFYIILKIPW
jgi:hypothetical protein